MLSEKEEEEEEENEEQEDFKSTSRDLVTVVNETVLACDSDVDDEDVPLSKQARMEEGK